MGISLIAYDHMPKDWAMLDYTSGKRVLLNLIDGRTVELPKLDEIPELEFEPSLWWGSPHAV